LPSPLRWYGPLTPPLIWPPQGVIELRNLRVQYRHDTPAVLENVSATIKASEKIGICGRTGAGKSSLISTLLRLVDVIEGICEVDGVDIRSIGTADLRQAMAIIPQESFLFAGTLRQVSKHDTAILSGGGHCHAPPYRQPALLRLTSSPSSPAPYARTSIRWMTTLTRRCGRR